MHPHSEDDSLDPPEVSKTQRKRAMHDRQELGAALVELSETRLAELALPERLLDAILEAKRIAKFGALRRQLQYIGKLMRDAQLDVPAIEAQLEAWNGPSRQATAYLHLLERWRDRLLADDAALGELVQAFPDCDLQRVRALVRNARKEQAAAQAPASYRQLFQVLKQIIPEPRPPA
ncbi:MAG: DUF615 domain-containing protein [Burkholderiales bacterium]|nr:DUF615 domain-containing protein [Burkholderiales bacterium]